MVRSKSKPRRRTPTRKPVKAKRKKSTAKKTSSGMTAPIETRQLAVYHNPFARTTKQPKIPDGKVTESLGFQTQAVKEFDTISGGDGITHMLIYPGQDAALLVTGDAESNAAFTTIKYNCLGFTGSNGVNWSSVDGDGGSMVKLDTYALWRTVSCGAVVSLLNPNEQDDGWWEAVRITEPREPYLFGLFNKDCSANNTVSGTVAPVELLGTLLDNNLVNERSYATGLLRDLKNYHFNLNGLLDHHDFRQQTIEYTVDGNEAGTLNSGDKYLTFGDGQLTAQTFINSMIDPGYDMIYLRLHGRSASGSTSRYHVNVVSNQEITFGNEERESRFMTGSANIGSAAMSAHASAKRMNGAAAHRIVP